MTRVNNRIKIIYVIEGDGGGAVSHVLSLAKELAKKEITVFTIFVVDGSAVGIAKKWGLNFKLISKKSFLDVMLIWRLVLIFYKEKVEIIHTHTIRCNFYARIASLLYLRPKISLTTVHSHIADEVKGNVKFGFKDWLLCKRETYTSKLVYHFICVSSKIKQRLLSNHMPESKLTVIENGVEIPNLSLSHIYNKSIRGEFSIGDNEIIVGIVGRLVPLKNHNLFINAAKRLSEVTSNIKFLIIGDGPLLELLYNKVRKIGISKKVVFTGWRNDIQNLLCAIDIFVICSEVEGLNISVLEAMASAKPVIGTNVKGISEIILDNKTGILVPPNNVDSLTEAVLRLVNNKDERTNMGLNGRQLIEKEYSVQQMIDKTFQLYKNLYSNVLDSRV